MDKTDRCDRCGAEAIHKFRSSKDENLELVFCQHHTNQYLAPLGKAHFVCVESKELVAA